MRGRGGLAVAIVLALAFGCSSADDESSGGSTGGTGATGGSSATGGAGGSGATGGSSGSGATGGGAGAPVAGAGGEDAGPVDAAGDAPSDSALPDAAPKIVTLLKQQGAVFTPTAAAPMKKLSFGTKGTVYGWVRVELDVKAGGWQPEIPDEGANDRTEHILFALRRNHSDSNYRYLMGAAAVTFASKAPHFRMFGRKSLGPGDVTYTSWSTTYGWQNGALYHLDCLLDGVADLQRCELSLGGSVVKALQGTVAYLDPTAHLSSGFYVELGSDKLNTIEASPLGWAFSNLVVTAALMP